MIQNTDHEHLSRKYRHEKAEMVIT